MPRIIGSRVYDSKDPARCGTLASTNDISGIVIHDDGRRFYVPLTQLKMGLKPRKFRSRRLRRPAPVEVDLADLSRRAKACGLSLRQALEAVA